MIREALKTSRFSDASHSFVEAFADALKAKRSYVEIAVLDDAGRAQFLAKINGDRRFSRPIDGAAQEAPWPYGLKEKINEFYFSDALEEAGKFYFLARAPVVDGSQFYGSVALKISIAEFFSWIQDGFETRETGEAIQRWPKGAERPILIKQKSERSGP